MCFNGGKTGHVKKGYRAARGGAANDIRKCGKQYGSGKEAGGRNGRIEWFHALDTGWKVIHRQISPKFSEPQICEQFITCSQQRSCQKPVLGAAICTHTHTLHIHGENRNKQTPDLGEIMGTRSRCVVGFSGQGADHDRSMKVTQTDYPQDRCCSQNCNGCSSA